MRDEQSTLPANTLAEFYNEDAKTAWLAGRTIEQIDLWERACFECNLTPPADRAAFLAALPGYPQLEAWREKFICDRTEAVKASLKAQMAAAGVPDDMQDDAVAKAVAELGDRIAGVSIDGVKVVKLSKGEKLDPQVLRDLLGDGADGEILASSLSGADSLLAAMMGDEIPDPQEMIKMVEVLVDLEKRREREKCIELIEALDAEGGKRFADAIRFRAKEEEARSQCDCPKCTAKRAQAEADAQTTEQ